MSHDEGPPKQRTPGPILPGKIIQIKACDAQRSLMYDRLDGLSGPLLATEGILPYNLCPRNCVHRLKSQESSLHCIPPQLDSIQKLTLLILKLLFYAKQEQQSTILRCRKKWRTACPCAARVRTLGGQHLVEAKLSRHGASSGAKTYWIRMRIHCKFKQSHPSSSVHRSSAPFRCRWSCPHHAA